MRPGAGLKRVRKIFRCGAVYPAPGPARRTKAPGRIIMGPIILGAGRYMPKTLINFLSVARAHPIFPMGKEVEPGHRSAVFTPVKKNYF